MQVHVDPDEVDQFTRPHRPPGAVLHPDVQVLRRDTRFVENADAVVEERNQDAVDDEAGRVVAADRRLAETRAEGVRGLERVLGSELGADDLDERHQRGRVEEVHAEDALRPLGRSPDLRHGEGRRIRREHGIRADDRLELGEEPSLRLELLHDRLDHEVAACELGELGRQREPTDGIVAGGLLERPLLDLAREEVRDAVASALGEVERDLAADRLDAGLDAELRDPGTHRTEPYDADPRDLPRHGGDPTALGLTSRGSTGHFRRTRGRRPRVQVRRRKRRLSAEPPPACVRLRTAPP